jgi:hypothetical protein
VLPSLKRTTLFRSPEWRAWTGMVARPASRSHDGACVKYGHLPVLEGRECARCGASLPSAS